MIIIYYIVFSILILCFSHNEVFYDNMDIDILYLIQHPMNYQIKYETLKELKKIEGFNTPVVALTADAISGAKEKYLKEGRFVVRWLETDIEVLPKETVNIQIEAPVYPQIGSFTEAGRIKSSYRYYFYFHLQNYINLFIL